MNVPTWEKNYILVMTWTYYRKIHQRDLESHIHLAIFRTNLEGMTRSHCSNSVHFNLFVPCLNKDIPQLCFWCEKSFSSAVVMKSEKLWGSETQTGFDAIFSSLRQLDWSVAATAVSLFTLSVDIRSSAVKQHEVQQSPPRSHYC